MGRTRFADLLAKRSSKNPHPTSKRSTPRSRRAGEELKEDEAPGTAESTEAVNVPDDAVEIPAKVYTTESGDLLVIPDEPLEVEGLGEPLEQVEISLVDEVEDDGEGEEGAEPAEMVTEGEEELHEGDATPEEPIAAATAAPDTTIEDTQAVLDTLNNPEVKTSFFKGGSTQNPKWFVTANGDIVASLSYSAVPDESGKFKEFFASDNFPAKVMESSKVIGWDTVLANFKAEIFTKKSRVITPEKVDRAAMLNDVRSQLKNDLSLAYSAMTARLRSNPFAASLFEAVAASGMDSPEVFVAAVIQKSAQEFVTELNDVLDEVSDMSEPVKAEFKKLIARTTIPVEAGKKYTPDQSFMSRLQENSIPVTTTATVSRTSRFSGIL